MNAIMLNPKDLKPAKPKTTVTIIDKEQLTKELKKAIANLALKLVKEYDFKTLKLFKFSFKVKHPVALYNIINNDHKKASEITNLLLQDLQKSKAFDLNDFKEKNNMTISFWETNKKVSLYFKEFTYKTIDYSETKGFYFFKPPVFKSQTNKSEDKDSTDKSKQSLTINKGSEDIKDSDIKKQLDDENSFEELGSDDEETQNRSNITDALSVEDEDMILNIMTNLETYHSLKCSNCEVEVTSNEVLEDDAAFEFFTQGWTVDLQIGALCSECYYILHGYPNTI